MSAWLLLIAVGCQAPDAEDSSTTEDTTSAATDTSDSSDTAQGDTAPPVDSGEYLAEDQDVPPEVDLEALGTAATAIFSDLWRYNAAEVFELYDELVLRFGEEDCPRLNERTTSVYWNGSCTSAAGATFDGYLSRTITEGGENFTAAALIDTPDGTLSLSGDYFYARQESGATGNWRFRIDGPTTWDGGWPKESWLGEGADSRLSMEGLKNPTGSVQSTVSGRLLGLTGAVEAVVFSDEGAIIHEGGGCPQEISGAVTLLVDGIWVDVFFDGPLEVMDKVDPESCDGCGDAWARGYHLGEVCIDPSGLMSWVAAGEAPF